MKTNHLRRVTLLCAASLALVAGCSSNSASTAAAPGSNALFQPQPEIAQPAPALVAAVEPQFAPQNPQPAPVVSRNVADIAQLAKSGVSEKLMLTFVQNTRTPFNLGAAEIIYLNDVGVSETVIDTMLRHDRELGVAASAQPASAATVIVQQQPAPAPEPQTVIVVQEPAPVSVNYFYENLSPYGSWVEVEDYGRCWQPTVVIQQPGWRPYCDRGHWRYTSRGWYWESDYSWGATFHYGRWFHHARRGWCWLPDTNWGPAWVSWRDSSDYCGWAPLPPTACYRPGVGFTYRNENVSVSFGFGLSADCYTFVPRNHFGNGRPQNHAVPQNHNTQIINNTTVVNNYVTGNNNTVINQGLATPSVPASVAPVRDPRLTPHFANPTRHNPIVRQPSATSATATQPLAPSLAPAVAAPAAATPALVNPVVKNPRLPNWPNIRPNLPVRSTPQIENQTTSTQPAPTVTQPSFTPVKATPAVTRFQNLAPVRQPQIINAPVVQAPVAQAVAQNPHPAMPQNWQAAADNFRQQHPNVNLPTRSYTPAAQPSIRQQPQPAQSFQAPAHAQPAPQNAPVVQPAAPARSQQPAPQNAADVRKAIADAIEKHRNDRR